MKLKKFNDFINEKQTDPDLVLKMQEYMRNQGDKCPRCGKNFSECICMERDYASTVNLYRLGKGKIKKANKSFKKDE